MNKSLIVAVFLAIIAVAVAQQPCLQARVLGAGVVGLLGAIQLQKLGFNVTIHAYASPIQNSEYVYYASPHAGAWWSGNWNNYSYASYSALQGLTVSEPLSTAIQRTANVYYASAPTNPYELGHQYYADYFQNYTAQQVNNTYGGLFGYGYSMTAVIVSAPKYISYLAAKFIHEGGTIVHENVTRLSYLTNMPNTDLVINSPGLGALWLGDVMDTTMFPQRGQTIIVSNPAVTQIYRARSPVDSSDPGSYGTYILPRFDGQIVLGGTRQDNVWNSSVNAQDKIDIMRRAGVMCPTLANGNFTWIKDNVGFRPARQGGIRVEVDSNSAGLFNVPVIHHYGHAGNGFEESWGSTQSVIQLVMQMFPNNSNCSASNLPTSAPTSSPTNPASPATSAPTKAATVKPGSTTGDCAHSITSSASRVKPFNLFNLF